MSGSMKSGSAGQTATAGAGGRSGRHDQADQNLAHEAVSAGEAAPLNSVLAIIRKAVPGEVLDVALGPDPKGMLTYQVTVLTKDGEYCDITVDAKRAKLMQMTFR